MDTNSIILELLSRIKVLEEKVCILEAKVLDNQKGAVKAAEKPEFPTNQVSDKYRALAEYLYERWDKKIVLSYEEIESILGFKLPPTAYKLPQSYWANTMTHSYATSWLSVGYKARINSEAKTVTFERLIY